MGSVIPTTRLDIMSEAVAADPWPTLRALREQGPVVWHETYGRWLVTTDRAVRKVATNFARFTVEGTVVEEMFGADAFISMDDRRRHDDLRNVWAEAFRKQGLDRLRPAVERIVAGLMAPVAARLNDGEAVDLSQTLCRPIPTLVIALLMGVPDEALPDIVRWSDAMAAGGTTYLSETEAARARIAREAAKQGLADYLLALIAARRVRPGDDLVSVLVHAPAGAALPDDQLVQNLRQLLFAGNETTAKWLAHIFVTYGERGDTRRALVADRTLIPPANDEVMRWQGVVGTIVRRVRGGPIELAGVELADGAALTCLLAAANRDPDRYDDPDRFDLHRPARPNLGFGVGFHNCLGSVLAKMEAEIGVNALLDAEPDYAVAAPYAYSSVPMRGPMPVVVAHDRG
ncbi:cytochrome P450 [Sphingomonas solaris]|uniref:cytochrome P450 n=1 Tax=Alterirhizorhabdus solaris TaxID=2529389 RepID=UPI001396AD87|nr:cytochrome P450 [Sphingomonas solaris]